MEFAKLEPTSEEQKAMFDTERGLERLNRHIAEVERSRYTIFYNLVVAEEKRIKNDPIKIITGLEGLSMELIILFYMLIKILIEQHQIHKAERHAEWLYGK